MAGDTVARYDVAIIGAGLNGLTAAGCLAQARRRVLVLEARDRLGGTAASAELAPGFIVDPLAGPGWISDELRRDLNLDRHGLTLLAPESSLASVGPESESPLVLRRDQRQTMSAIRQRSPRDADRWPAFAERVGRLSGFLGWLYHRAPPRPKGAGLAQLARPCGPRTAGAHAGPGQSRRAPACAADADCRSRRGHVRGRPSEGVHRRGRGGRHSAGPALRRHDVCLAASPRRLRAGRRRHATARARRLRARSSKQSRRRREVTAPRSD